MRVTVYGLGAFSFHVLVADVNAGRMSRIFGCKKLVRLGEGALRDRVIDIAGQTRAAESLDEMASRARPIPSVDKIVAVATSVFREADNGGAVAAALGGRLGEPIRVLGGIEEAGYTYRGARSEMAGEPGTMAVVDIGGGTVGIAVGEDASHSALYSLPLGVLRLRDVFVPPDGVVSRSAIKALERAVGEHAAEAARRVRELKPKRILFAAGTVKALRRLGGEPRGLLSRQTVRDLVARLTALPPSALMDLGVDAGRSDTIAVGSIVVGALMDLLGAKEVTVADRGMREGVALGYG